MAHVRANGSSSRLEFAQAGADALELNVYYTVTDLFEEGQLVEQKVLDGRSGEMVQNLKPTVRSSRFLLQRPVPYGTAFPACGALSRLRFGAKAGDGCIEINCELLQQCKPFFRMWT